MSGNLDTYLHVTAASTGVALPRAAKCHVHLAARPMAIALYKLAGDAASPLAVLYGTDRARPKLLVAPEPRSREIRFDLLNELMADLLAWLRATPEDEAPQLLVANPATAQFLGVLGRSLRHPPRSSIVPEATVYAGRHLAWLAERAEHPGSAVVIAMTAVLSDHWRTGQSDLEDSQLPTALAWIDPPIGVNGRDAALAAEAERRDSPAGPASDPRWDEQLAELVSEFNAARNGRVDPATVASLAGPITKLCEDALSLTWRDLWHARDLLLRLPPAPSAASRFDDDARAWSWWRTYAEVPDARIANMDSARRAARLLDERERAQAALESQQSLDDPLRFAAVEADGRAIRGAVRRADYDRRLVPPGRRNRVRRPLLTVELPAPSAIRPGTDVWSADDPRVAGNVIDRRENPPEIDVELRSFSPRTGPPALLPGVGDTVRLTSMSPEVQQRTPLHDLRDVWTHRNPPLVPADPAVNTDEQASA